MVDLLLAKGAAVDVVDDDRGRTPLSYAEAKHSQSLVQLLLAAHANPNAGTRDLPLTLAAYYGDIPALKLLLANGADANAATNVSGEFKQIHGLGPSGGIATPLAAAISQKHADAVAELIRAKADPNGSTADGIPLIFSALWDAPTLKALLEGGADPNRPDQAGCSPLLQAVTMSQGGTAVELLLTHKADVNAARPNDGLTSLHLAAMGGSTAIAATLLKAGADVDARITRAGRRSVMRSCGTSQRWPSCCWPTRLIPMRK